MYEHADILLQGACWRASKYINKYNTTISGNYYDINTIFITTIIISLIAPIFWDEHKVANFSFQESLFLNIIPNYSQNLYHKLSCCISSLREEEYIKELITTVYPCHCKEVFYMPLEIFLALRDWLILY